MRRSSSLPTAPPLTDAHALRTVRALFPYVWQFRGRVLLALFCLVAAKVAAIAVPVAFKAIVDAMTPGQAALAVPLALLLAYGALRFASALFAELREVVFAKVAQGAVRHLALQVFRHLHALSLRFHLERQTGGLSRDIERGTRSIGSLISYTLYSILPTFIEIALVLAVLAITYELSFALITFVTLAAYIAFTFRVTDWRTKLRRISNDADSQANTRAIDSLLNYETVKYFNNEDYEAKRYDAQMEKWADAATRTQVSLSYLNIGQGLIIAVGVTLIMWRAASGVAAGSMTLGDLVLVNAFLIQLYIPLNYLGVMYRELRQSLADIERLFRLLEEEREVADAPDAEALPQGPVEVRFEGVDFSYDSRRPILRDVSFDIAPGRTVAVVGHSGSGKSTLARLLYRFYDVGGGAIRINGRDLRHLTQTSLRRAIGIVPQDTVLFNDSIYYNIQYGRPDASRDEVIAAARAAHIHDFVTTLPDGYDTRVGERGLKLSGGEKQRVAIARALLKNPPMLIFDEATSALDSRSEKAIQAEIEFAGRGRTVLVIAHRLSTVMNADEILVMDGGRIAERGSHADLLACNGLYAQMWALQKREEATRPESLSFAPAEAASPIQSRMV